MMNVKSENRLMLDKLIKTVSNQIDYFHNVLQKNKKKSAVQARIWALICENEAILEYLEIQKENLFPGEIISGNTPALVIKLNCIPRKQHQKTLYLESVIFKIIDEHSGDAPVSHVRDCLQTQGLSISESKLSNRLYNMHRRRRVIDTLKKGFYHTTGVATATPKV